MGKKLRVLMIGAHPDDCDISCGGTALKYIAAGHTVKFLSLCNGDRGHHEMTPEEIRVRRRGESLAVSKFAGLEYDVWEDSHDCMVEAPSPTASVWCATSASSPPTSSSATVPTTIMPITATPPFWYRMRPTC